MSAKPDRASSSRPARTIKDVNHSVTSDPVPSADSHLAETPDIDPSLLDESAPPPPNGASAPETTPQPSSSTLHDPFIPLTITESIAQAPNPRHTDFRYSPDADQKEPEAIDESALAALDEEIPGSPTAKLLRAVAPAAAVQPNSSWPTPPSNASVNLFIGRALLANGNDNWPLKPNDIVSWIRKHYPAEWDGDEGRCSAHRVRTYLARKGADMYYEKLNQGSIAGWRIRQNHLWRFENGGFQGRGMKQEEAIAQAHKETEAIVTAAHKADAAKALAAGHPGVKVSMSQPGVTDGSPAPKRQRIKVAAATSRRKGKRDEGTSTSADTSFYTSQPYGDSSSFMGQASGSSLPLDPMLMANATNGDGQVDMNMVQQALQSVSGGNNIDELEMGMQLPSEMLMHGEQDEGRDWEQSRAYGNSGPYYGAQQGYAAAYGPSGPAQ